MKIMHATLLEYLDLGTLRFTDRLSTGALPFPYAGSDCKKRLMFMVCATTEGHVGIRGLAAAGGWVDAPGPCYHQRPCLWSVPLPEDVLSVVCVAIEGHAGIHGAHGCADVFALYCHQRPS